MLTVAPKGDRAPAPGGRRSRKLRRLAGAAASLGAGAIWALACTPLEPPKPPPGSAAAAVTAETVAKPTQPATASDPLPEYLPAPTALRILPAAPGEGDGGFIVDGLRITASGLAATDVGAQPITGGQPIPPRLGGGFLLWSRSALYRAASFRAPLEPLQAIEDGIKHVSFGPASVLLRTGEGQRLHLGLPGGAPLPVTPPGTAAVAALPSGAAVALLEDGRALCSAGPTAGAPRSWRQIAVGAQVAGLAERSGALWLELHGGGALRVAEDGTESRLDRLPVAPGAEPSPNPGEQLEVLERAVAAGAVLDEHTVLAPHKGAVVRLDRRTGRIISRSEAVVPAGHSCELEGEGDHVLLLCRGSDSEILIYSQVARKARPVLERTLPNAPLYAAQGAGLIYAGPCSGTGAGTGTGTGASSAGVACVRRPDGTYKQIEHREQDETVLLPRWIPEPGGTAQGILVPRAAEGKSGQAAVKLLDHATGRTRSLPDLSAEGARALFAPEPERLRLIVDRAWSALPGGSLRGYQGNVSFSISADGQLTRSSFPLKAWQRSGRFGYGLDGSGSAWQTTDFGQSWIEILRPPQARQGQLPPVQACSPVGCALQRWLRFGWPTSDPRRLLAVTTAPPAPQPAGARPTLSCQQTAAAKSAAAYPELRETNGYDLPGLGAQTHPAQRGETDYVAGAYHHILGGRSGSGSVIEGPRALAHGLAVELNDDGSISATARLNRTVWYVPPFAPAAKVERAQLSFMELLRAIPPGSVDMLEMYNASGEGEALALLAGSGGDDGLLLMHGLEGPLFTIGGGSPRARAYSLSHELQQLERLGAVATGPDTVALLVQGEDCATRVIEMSAGGSRILFDLPRLPADLACLTKGEHLAVAPDGSLGVIRIASGPPTRLDPALLLRPREPLITLAPWSELKAASDPACQSDTGGYRALVSAQPAWLAVTDSGMPAAEDLYPPMIARVRWSETQLCLEAVEVGMDPLSLENEELPTRLVARFSQPAGAGRVGFTLGAEVRQPLQCTVVSPPP